MKFLLIYILSNVESSGQKKTIPVKERKYLSQIGTKVNLQEQNVIPGTLILSQEPTPVTGADSHMCM